MNNLILHQTEYLFHNIFIDADFLVLTSATKTCEHLRSIISAACAISNRICLRCIRAPDDFTWTKYNNIVSDAIEDLKNVKVFFNKKDLKDLNDSFVNLFLCDEPSRVHGNRGGRYLEYKYGRVEKNFDENFYLKRELKHRQNPENKVPRLRIISLLKQALTIFTFENQCEDMQAIQTVINESLQVIEELGILPFHQFCLKMVQVLYKVEREKDEQLAEYFIHASTVLRSSFIIADKAVKDAEVQETLISDNLWAGLYIISEEMKNYRPDTRLGADWEVQEEETEKPRWWDEYFMQETETVLDDTKKDFKKWIIQLHSRASAKALENFLDTVSDEMCQKENGFPSFLELFSLLAATENVKNRVYPILNPLNPATMIGTPKDSLEKKQKRIQKLVRLTVGYGKEFETIKGGAILLMARDIPSHFSFFHSANDTPLAEFGIRLSQPKFFEQLPVQTKIWNIVSDYEKIFFFEEVRGQLYHYLNKDNSQIKLNTKKSRINSGTDISVISPNAKNVIDGDLAFLEKPVAEVTKLVKKYCLISPFTSECFNIKYTCNPNDRTLFKASVTLPIDFLVTGIFESNYYTDMEVAKNEVALLILTEIKRKDLGIEFNAPVIEKIHEPKRKATQDKVVVDTWFERKMGISVSVNPNLPKHQTCPHQLYYYIIENIVKNKTCDRKAIEHYLINESEIMEKEITRTNEIERLKGVKKNSHREKLIKVLTERGEETIQLDIIQQEILHEEKRKEELKAIENIAMKKLIFPNNHPFHEANLYLYEIRFSRIEMYYDKIFNYKELQETDACFPFSDENCFGILSAAPLGVIAPFLLYDRIQSSKSSSKENVLGIMQVQIVPVKSMIRLDKQEIMDLEHFHRVVAIINNTSLFQGKFYRDVFTSIISNSHSGEFEFDNMRTNGQKFGHQQYLFVPITIGKSLQLPWKGYDIDWAMITEMHIFEKKMLKILKAKQDFQARFESKNERLKAINKAYRRLSSVEIEDEAVLEERRALQNESDHLRIEIAKDFGDGKFYLGNHPLTGHCREAMKRKLNLLAQLNNKVTFTPWTKLEHAPRDFEKPAYDYDDEMLRMLYPRSNQFYLRTERDQKSTGVTIDCTVKDATKPVSYYEYATIGFDKKKVTKTGEEINRVFPKYPNVVDKDEKLISVKSKWMNSDQMHKMFLSRSFEQNISNKDEYPMVGTKRHFKEHLEVFFLNADMIRQSSRLSSIANQISKLTAMEDFRRKIAIQSFYSSQNFDDDTYVEYEASKFETLKFSTTKRFAIANSSEIQFLQKRKMKRFSSRYDSEEQATTIAVDYDFKHSVNFDNATTLGLIYPIPVFGEHTYYMPPSALEVNDKLAKYNISVIHEASNKENQFSKIKAHISERYAMSWKATEARRKVIGDTRKYCDDLFTTSTKLPYPTNNSRKINLEDQMATLPTWRKRSNLKAQNDFQNIDLISSPEFFKNDPSFIDWNSIIQYTKEHLYNQLTTEGKIRNLLVQLSMSEEHYVYMDLIEGDPSISRNCSPKTKPNDNSEYYEELMSHNTHADYVFIDGDIMGPPASLLVRCFTQESAGEVKNLTRMEFIGDSFLKLATTRVLYDDYSIVSPGALSGRRSDYVKNANLMKISDVLSLGQLMIVLPISNSTSIIYPFFSYYCTKLKPDDFSFEPQYDANSDLIWHNGNPYQVIEDSKKLADTVESIIGAYLVTGGAKMAAQLLLTFNAIYREKEDVTFIACPPPSMWPDPGDEVYASNIYQKEITMPTATEEKLIKQIISRIKDTYLPFKFTNYSLARLSLSMKGYEAEQDNERLEFLGDAVLDYLVAFEYYNNHQHYHSPKELEVGELTAAKQAITSNNSFGSIGFSLFFPHSILTKDRKKLSQLEDFKSQLKTAHGIPLNPDLVKVLKGYPVPPKAKVLNSNYLLDVPKWFGDIYEAIFGAVWLDQHQSLSKMWKIIRPHLEPLMVLGSANGHISFRSLNPRKYCEEMGKIEQKMERLKDESTFQKYGLKKEDYIYVDKWVCELKLTKDNGIVKVAVGIGSSENSASFNTATKLLLMIEQ